MIDAARNKVRVKACYVMMAATLGACLVMVFLGKRVSGNRQRTVCTDNYFSPQISFVVTMSKSGFVSASVLII